MRRVLPAFVLLATAALPAAPAQPHLPAKVPLSLDRYYRYDEILAKGRAIAEAYPDLVRVEVIGQSLEGRDLVVFVVHSRKTGDDRQKPAMWIDANVHGNEIQGAEVVLYTLHYLTRAYGVVDELTRLLDQKSFYLMPSQNPDGREHWFEAANTGSSSRGNRRPVDDDHDGVADEDPYDDVDGDGSITTMWQEDPTGDWIRDATDPRVFRRAIGEEQGGWRRLGLEGTDDDADGRVNEDPPGGDDMNRNWPTDWQPVYVQQGAGPFPFSAPETRAIGEFLLDHPNVAAVQSYHNAGGMILRPPGAAYRDQVVPPADARVYDELGKQGERLLPYYRYMIIWKDLYTVHGGFVNWTGEGLGIFSFTNEMWTASKWLQDGQSLSAAEERRLIGDRLQFGQTFTDYREHDHPTHGRVLIGGPNRFGSRTTPLFLLEEECHRNFAFTMYHADQMPLLEWGRVATSAVAPGLFAVTVEVRNERLIPTRSGIARQNGIGRPDLVICIPGAGKVVAGGVLERFDAPSFTAARHEPGRLRNDDGVPGRDARAFRFLVEAPAGTDVAIRYAAEKAWDLERRLVLAE